ncbi:uncharacterized protein LOC115443577 [Manduca sexta]|uniref:Folded gastrulation N-terminal domain-containing protein n=1 Tax=Manduca sexta TaxID=7130 RepID=A0A922CLX0_MANSE|nr:uncharacterized protein LOC115443577 [Manduca sexta]KAG6450243.1 hypothetical protein O3G_MSEX006477 [Manduca sexta]
MWCTWTVLLVSCTLVKAAEVEVTTETAVPVATTRAPPRTLDRQAGELAWKSWLQSAESGNQNAPPRRITTKSLFITPFVCPKGQRLDRNGCVQVVTVNKDEHERILLEQLNALFTSAPSGDNVLYDYGDGDDQPGDGPLQLNIPIGLDPQAAPFQGQEPSGQAQDLQGNYANIDKKDINKQNGDASVEAELEILKLQNSRNNTGLPDGVGVLNHNVLTNLHYPEKPKRDSPLNITDIEALNVTTDEGQKEFVYGHVNVDPVIYNAENQNKKSEELVKDQPTDLLQIVSNSTSTNGSLKQNSTEEKINPPSHVLKKDGDHSKLSPENDYSDIGEAIKLISRYAEVTTDDNFAKDIKKAAIKEDSVLGTRTKLQHRRNKPRPTETKESEAVIMQQDSSNKNKLHTYGDLINNGVIYRYPWPSQHAQSPPPGYPFRHLQDYWPGQNKIGGVYNTHENPRRHHHSYPHNFRPHSYPYYGVYPGAQDTYPEQLKRFIHRVAQHHASPQRSHTNNQDLYSLLGLRHWFSSEGTAKR